MLSNIEHVEHSTGNNQISVECPNLSDEIQTFTKEDNGYQSIKFFFTYHIKEPESFEQAFERLSKLIDLCEKYIWGQEYGKSGKTPHIQGAFILKVKKRWNTLNQSYFLNNCWGTKLKNWSHAFQYCIKEYNTIYSSEKIPKPLKIISTDILYDWQKTIIKNLSQEPNDRDILWVAGDYGCGKTQFSKYLVYHKLAMGPLEGNKSHMLCVVSQHTEWEGFLIYLTADESKYQTHNLFNCLEKIKDGFFMSHFGTENTKPVLMNSPHIVVCSNCLPDFTKTNMDPKRFIITNLLKDDRDADGFVISDEEQ